MAPLGPAKVKPANAPNPALVTGSSLKNVVAAFAKESLRSPLFPYSSIPLLIDSQRLGKIKAPVKSLPSFIPKPGLNLIALIAVLKSPAPAVPNKPVVRKLLNAPSKPFPFPSLNPFSFFEPSLLTCTANFSSSILSSSLLLASVLSCLKKYA